MKLTCYVTDKKIGSEKEREWEEVPRTSLLVNADLASLESPSDAGSTMLELPFCLEGKKVLSNTCSRWQSRLYSRPL